MESGRLAGHNPARGRTAAGLHDVVNGRSSQRQAPAGACPPARTPARHPVGTEADRRPSDGLASNAASAAARETLSSERSERRPAMRAHERSEWAVRQRDGRERLRPGLCRRVRQRGRRAPRASAASDAPAARSQTTPGVPEGAWAPL